MFGKNYIEEEVRKKISSMKQLDRIEFITKTNTLTSSSGSFLTSMLVLSSMILIVFLFGINFILRAKSFFFVQLNSLGEMYLMIGFASIIWSFLLFLLFTYSMLDYNKQVKEYKKRLEEFLEEHSK